MTSVPLPKPPSSVPMFFGAPERQLFGMYHAPGGDVVRDVGVVLCYSGPQEYTQVHWAYQKLAGLLSDAGLPVLRFDYSGTGDSAGDSAMGLPSRWTEDIGTAVSELRDVAGTRRVALVGVRLGGALVLEAVRAGVKARDVVLWDPVVRGDQYVAQLDAAEDFRLRLANFPEPNTRASGELLGYPFTVAQREATLAVSVEAGGFGRIDRLLLVAASLNDGQRRLQARAEAEGIEVVASEVDDPPFHAPDRHPNDPVLSHNIPVAITTFLARSAV